MTTETSNAREWVLVPRGQGGDVRVDDDSYRMMVEALQSHLGATRPGNDEPESQWLWDKAQSLLDLFAAPPPAAARGDVRGLVDALVDAAYQDGMQELDAMSDETLSARSALEQALAAEGVQAGEVEQRAREADRQRFTDPEFNAWLDTGISDAGHTVWDAVGDTQAAWAGWEARQFAGDAVLISECCGREECGGECGNEWRGMTMCRKPAEALSQQPEARDVDGSMVRRALRAEYEGHGSVRDAFATGTDWAEEMMEVALTAALTGERNV